VPKTSLEWIDRTALGHWGGAFSAVDEQGPKPATLMLPSATDCELFATSGDAKFVDRGKFSFTFKHDPYGRYFDFEPASQAAKFHAIGAVSEQAAQSPHASPASQLDHKP